MKQEPMRLGFDIREPVSRETLVEARKRIERQNRKSNLLWGFKVILTPLLFVFALFVGIRLSIQYGMDAGMNWVVLFLFSAACAAILSVVTSIRPATAVVDMATDEELDTQSLSEIESAQSALMMLPDPPGMGFITQMADDRDVLEYTKVVHASGRRLTAWEIRKLVSAATSKPGVFAQWDTALNRLGLLREGESICQPSGAGVDA